VKLLIEDLVKVGPLPSLAIIAAAFAAGIAASVMADRRDALRDQAKKNTSPSTA
jgi:hypothetical protein